ncbi:hypothetical protein L596_018915 [Steinernema carpocapsae]|uniref:Uncharacterized protein n=1 Tax=Steinernema carpocapsae TaxID=34508 RepID=A0A4U5N624_STECR|nr:hypothetical protein L596_018915 [Steinernema carpocapsae]
MSDESASAAPEVKPRIFVVTGANRGIGFAIVRGIAKQAENAVVYLTSRDAEAGVEAVNQIKTELGADLKSEVRTTTLDIADQKSVDDLAELLKAEHDGVDVLVNNAGIAFNEEIDEDSDEESSQETENRRRIEQTQSVLDVNYYGTKRVCNTLVPIMRPGGRIVNVTGKYKSELTADLLSVKVKVEDIDNFIENFQKLIQADDTSDVRFSNIMAAYKISKAAELAMTKVLARELKAKHIRVNACCPGYVATRLSDFEGSLTCEQGADTPVLLALERNAPGGTFVFERKILPWY